MKRPWQVWLALAACGALASTAMAWMTFHALRADRERSAAVAAADLEQRISLALWRMDTKLAPLIAAESARPHFYYSPLIPPLTADPSAQGQAAPIASPLLRGTDVNVLLNFDATPGGPWNSPQAPPPELVLFACANGMNADQIELNRRRLSELSARVDLAELLAQLPVQPLPQWNASQPRATSEQEPLRRLQEDANAPYYANQQVANAASDGAAGDAYQFRGTPAPVAAASLDDLGDRGARYQAQVGQEYVKLRQENAFRFSDDASDANQTVESVSRAVWVGDQLILARRVLRNGATVVQGSWLNWPRLKKEMLAESADLVPGADLQPVRTGDAPDPTRMLAGLPVQLVASQSPQLAPDKASPLRWALGVGWAALAVALGAVALLLWGVMALSERRAAFVSSVTHELRTPLTTFRMYAEMLARDMVPTAERRREYLETLRGEAERLTHLVDNVLAYARLERGRRPRPTERTTVAALLARIKPRLSERTERAGMPLSCTMADDVAGASLHTDVGVVEQILFNLVDNAAKYAAGADDRRIHLVVSREGKSVVMTVNDHGPGFPSSGSAARSAPFSKTAEEAAESAPGVGLGLALCRRLARELGGRLGAANVSGETGASVALRLPCDF